MPKSKAANAPKPAGPRPVTAGVLRVAPLIPIPALLREADIEPDEVLSEVGLLLGQRSGLSTLGTVGYLMRSSPDVAAFRISSAPR